MSKSSPPSSPPRVQVNSSPDKHIFVLNIGDYEPEVTKYTYPLIEQYADRIGAKLTIITERKFPDHPVTFEKFQIYELADSDWSIYIDSDVLIHPEFYDVSALVPSDHVLLPYNNIALGRYALDRYFRRDGRYISASNYMSWVPRDCIDYWKPDLDRSIDDIVSSIYEIPREHFYTPQHRIDDYICSQNIAKYGLRVKLIDDIYEQIYNHTELEYYYHPEIKIRDKLGAIQSVYDRWQHER